MVYLLFHVINVNCFIFAPSDYETTIYSHCWQGGSVCMVSKVSHKSPFLLRSETHTQCHNHYHSSLETGKWFHDPWGLPKDPTNGENHAMIFRWKQRARELNKKAEARWDCDAKYGDSKTITETRLQRREGPIQLLHSLLYLLICETHVLFIHSNVHLLIWIYSLKY